MPVQPYSCPVCGFARNDKRHTSKCAKAMKARNLPVAPMWPRKAKKAAK